MWLEGHPVYDRLWISVERCPGRICNISSRKPKCQADVFWSRPKLLDSSVLFRQAENLHFIQFNIFKTTVMKQWLFSPIDKVWKPLGGSCRPVFPWGHTDCSLNLLGHLAYALNLKNQNNNKEETQPIKACSTPAQRMFKGVNPTWSFSHIPSMGGNIYGGNKLKKITKILPHRFPGVILQRKRQKFFPQIPFPM